MSLSPLITAVCREFFGRNVETRTGRRVHVDNRCGQCPLREPCVTWGGKPARTMDELQANNEEFAREAAIVLGQVSP